MGIQGKPTTLFKLRSLRALNNLTQEEMADKLHISKATYARKENGLCKFNAEEIVTIVGTFDVSFEEIFC